MNQMFKSSQQQKRVSTTGLTHLYSLHHGDQKVKEYKLCEHNLNLNIESINELDAGFFITI